MRCYTVRGFSSVEVGITIRPQIELGESGRGRKRTIVVAEGFSCKDEAMRVERARVGMTSSGPVLLPATDPDDDQRLLVMFRESPGYSRGATYSVPRPEGCVVVASGHGAWGDAGLLGQWEEALVIFPPTGRATIRSKYSEHVLSWSPELGLRCLSKEELDAEDAREEMLKGNVQML